MPRKPGHERRREIAHAVLRVIGTQGIASLTTATLAREVGVTTGALFRHFATLDAMLDETVLYALAEIETTFPDDALPPVRRLFALAANRVELFQREPGLSWLLRSDEAYLRLPAGASDSLRSAVKRSREFLLEAIRDGIEEGSIRSDIPAEVLLIAVMGAIHTLSGMSGLHRSAPGPLSMTPGTVLDGLERMMAPPDIADSE